MTIALAALVFRYNEQDNIRVPKLNDLTGYVQAVSAIVADGDKGDIILSGTGTVWTIDAGVVTLAKMADIATDRLIGRDTSGTGVPEALTVGGGIEFTGAGGIQRSALTGDATATAGGAALTLATVNASPGTFGSATAVPVVTVNGKGLVTSVTTVAIVPVTDGDKGDITVSSTGTVWTIDNDVVTYAKMQNVSATDRLLGRDTAGAGDVEELTVGGGIEFTGTGIQTSAFTGDATKAAGGTALTLATVNANTGAWGSATQVAQITLDGKGRATAAADVSIAIPSTQVTDFTEAAQDATGAMVDASLVYVDATPLLTRAALTGDATAAQGSNALTLATVNANVGSFGSATQVATFTVNAKGLTTAAANVTITPAVGSITGLGTGVATALAVNVGSAGAFVVNGGALGTPSSGTLTSCTGLPVSTGISGLGTGVATALAVNVGSAGAFVTFNGAGGTPSSLTLTNATGLPLGGLVASTTLAIGVGTVELGHATDTTLARSGAGDVTIEGNAIYRAGGTDVPLTDGGTGASTASGARTNLGLGTAATVNTGTSGATIPLLNAANTFSANQTITGSGSALTLSGSFGGGLVIDDGAEAYIYAQASGTVFNFNFTGPGAGAGVGALTLTTGVGADVNGEMRCDSLRIDAAPSVSIATASTHKLAFNANGTTFYILCSNV